MLNKVMLIGNVGADPEVRYLENQTQNGVTPKVATFRLATSERFRDRNGETRERTEWHNIVAWRQLADLCEKFIRKGTQIYVEGRLTTRSWDDQAGVKHYQTEIVADTIQLLGRRADNPAAGAPAYGPAQQAAPAYGPAAAPAQQAAPSSYGPAAAYASQPAPAAARPAYTAPAAPAPSPQPAPAAPASAPAADFVDAEPDDDLPF